jgi:hypothetical protein
MKNGKVLGKLRGFIACPLERNFDGMKFDKQGLLMGLLHFY